jgi:hypothetical protein
MYCSTASGTRYRMGFPFRTRQRISVEEMARAGISRRWMRWRYSLPMALFCQSSWLRV